MRYRKKKNHNGEKLDFTLSISDIMSGLLFIFIIILIYFIKQQQEITSQFDTYSAVRLEILKTLKKAIDKQLSGDEKVEIDDKRGVLKLSENHFFNKDQFEITKEGKKIITSLRPVLLKIFDCKKSPIKGICGVDKKGLLVESFFIEGHSDCRDVNKAYNAKLYLSTSKIGSKNSHQKKYFKKVKHRIFSNMQLSSLRAIKSFEHLVRDEKLLKIKNKNEEVIFSTSAYGKWRPQVSGDPENCSRPNPSDRRVELRVVMHLPEELERRKNDLKK